MAHLTACSVVIAQLNPTVRALQSPDEALGFFDSSCWYLAAFEFCRSTTGRVAKLARLVYRMLRYGMKYVDRGAAFYEAEHQRLQIKHLKWRAAKLGIQSHPTSGGLKKVSAKISHSLCKTSNRIS